MRRFGPMLLGILTLLTVAVVCFIALRWVKTQRSLQEELTARDVIHEQVKAILMNQGVLKMAARFGTQPGNVELARCVLPHRDQAAPCAVTNAKNQVSFALTESNDPGAREIAGTETEPALYSNKGALGCEPKNENCPGWQVIAWFWAECPNAAEQCDTASKIHVRYQVQGVGRLAANTANPPATLFEADPTAFAEAVAMTPGGLP